MRSLLPLFINFVFIALFSGCGWLAGGGSSFGAIASGSSGTTTTTYPIGTTLSFPAEGGKLVGWSTLLQGNCSVNGSTISIADSKNLTSATTTCTNNAWQIFFDVSSLPVGTAQIIITQLQSSTTYSPTTITIQKSNSNCDVLSNRKKNAAAGFAGGSGTLSNPFVICTAMQLQQMNGQPGSYSYILQNDIDFNNPDTNGDNVVDMNDADYVSGSGWTPVNLDGTLPNSIFYGSSFEIRNLTVENASTNNALFSSASYREIKNLTLSDVSVSGENAASVVSSSDSLVLVDVHASGAVSSSAGQGPAGGLVAMANALILRSSFSGSVSGGDPGAGGLVGTSALQYLLVADSFAKVAVSGGQSVGGIIGSMGIANPTILSNSYSLGSVSGTREVGGLIGSYGTIINSWSSATVLVNGSDSYFGGLSGYNAAIYNSFFAGNIEAGSGQNFGTLSGFLNPNQSGNYFWSGGACTGSGVCMLQGTGRANLASFQDVTQAPISSWDFVGSTTDGTEDHWVMLASQFPQVWWQQNSTFTSSLSGLGTAANPFHITSAADLMLIGGNTRYLDSNFILTANIDMSSKSFLPIGYRSGWSGTFDGGGYSVSHLSFSDANSDGIGFVSSAIGSSLKNLTLMNVSLTGQNDVGALAGFSAANISNVNVSGSVHGVSSIGGLAGKQVAFAVTGVTSTLTKDSAAVAVTATGAQVGGLVGFANNSNVNNSYATGTVTGVDQVGGLIGSDMYDTVTNSFSSGNVSGSTNVGGFIGEKSSDSTHYIQNNFSVSNVGGNSTGSDVGPIVGSYGDATNSTGNYSSAAGVTCNNAGTGGVNALLVNTQANVSAFYNPVSAPLSTWDFAGTWMNNFGTAALPSLQ